MSKMLSLFSVLYLDTEGDRKNFIIKNDLLIYTYLEREIAEEYDASI